MSLDKKFQLRIGVGDHAHHTTDLIAAPQAVTCGLRGRGWIANAAALREHIQSAPKPQASGDGIVALRLAITSTGAVSRIDATAGTNVTLRAAALKAAESWTFTPFSQGDVIAIVPISFHDGAAHSALWD
jgi:hypothetical protein